MNYKGQLTCPYGSIVSDWKSTVSTFDWTVEVPANTSATVYIPGREAANMKESGKPIGQVEGLRVLGVEGEYVKVGIGSGQWTFSSLQV